MTATPTKKPQPWHQVYQGDKECRFFKSLSRKKKNTGELLEWRTTSGLAKDSNLTQKEVESIIAKYLSSGIVQQHSKEPEKFRYWANAKKRKKKSGSISGEDKKRRINDAIGNSNP
jgi:hypothetical protein